jgi:ATP-binding cassette subfamily B protein
MQTLIICTGLVIIMLKAGQGVVDKTMTIGDFVLVNTYMIQLYLPLNFLGFVYREVKNSLVDMEKMFELSRVHATIQDDPSADTYKSESSNVEFSNVHFGYNKDREILKGVSFKVPTGDNIAIVGPSGAGKSTLSRLLFRFYDVDSGSIILGGQNIKKVQQKSLRAQIGVVPQDTVLFNDSIGYNIAYGSPGATQEEIEAVAKLAQIHKFVERLKEGYNTQVGERGLKLSGGEKQRVSIARALLKKPQILLFDEATSSLDTRTEKEILKAFKEISRNYTTITIAHRLSTVVDADQIIVLEDGKIVEQGTHQELLSQNGTYKAMWDSQSKEG